MAGARETSRFDGPKSTFVTGAGDRSGFISVYTFRGRRSTLDSLAGAVNRGFWTCGSFSEKSEEVSSLSCAALWHLDVVFGNALAANRLGRAA